MYLRRIVQNEEHDVMSDDDFDESDYLLEGASKVSFIRPKNYRRAMGCSEAVKCALCCGLCRSWKGCCPKSEPMSRVIKIGEPPPIAYPPNVIRNQKYNILTFLPLVLYEQFKFFLNLFFLVMAMTQLVPCLVVGSLYTYWGPLGFVVSATIIREAIDDLRRWKRDKEVNGQKYQRLVKHVDGQVATELIPSSEITVGDLIYIEKDQRVPADLVLLRTTDKTGTCFVRTDQLDGETDWKCRVAIPSTQILESDSALLRKEFSVFVEKPDKDIHSFIGNVTSERSGEAMGLSIQYTLWANTVLAAGSALGLVVYTGKETRSCMNNSQPRSKNGLLDREINTLTKVLFLAVIGLALMMMCLKGFTGPWYGIVYMVRFVLLFSYIIPLSLRVNLDFAKIFYSWKMSRDPKMPGCVVRCTTIPEELGRISYLLSDKTGTLTKNSMNFKKLLMGADRAYTVDDEKVPFELKEHFGSSSTDPVAIIKGQHTLAEAVLALAVCHNVTPVIETDDADSIRNPLQWQSSVDSDYFARKSGGVSYQASSPDEIALVSWADKVGLALVKRDRQMMELRTPQGDIISFSILQLFPFTSESKRMGIIVRNEATKEITFYMKGADVVMREIVFRQNWLDEVVNNMASEGLRTLVVAQKSLTQEEYDVFEAKYSTASAVTTNREAAVAAVLGLLERNMELVCVTGVEDELQDKVKETLEILREAGIKVWMLTGDKLETAVCIAKSSNLVDRINNESIYVFHEVTSTEDEQRTEINRMIEDARESRSVLVITGTTMEKCLKYYKSEFMEILCSASSVVVCRCSPTQKSQVVELIRKYTRKRTAAIGDGGNDVSMIQAADVGIGIAGKEGKQASLAADFSINEFCSLQRLFLIHGRWSYKRSATLSQFIIHRGLIISVMQAIFSTIFYFSSISLFPGFFMVGYATIYTMFPVFSLVLDKDFEEDDLALAFPHMYADLSKGRSLSFKTFFCWVLISIIQGGAIMYGSFIFFQDEYIHIVAIAFTALILTELIMVALIVKVWHYLIVLAELISLALYFVTLFVLRDYFDPQFLGTWTFVWKVMSVTLISCLPLIVLKVVLTWLNPSTYSKISSR